jgi:hypothetical protein
MFNNGSISDFIIGTMPCNKPQMPLRKEIIKSPLFLYSELSEYFENCILEKNNEEYVNKEYDDNEIFSILMKKAEGEFSKKSIKNTIKLISDMNNFIKILESKDIMDHKIRWLKNGRNKLIYKLE